MCDFCKPNQPLNIMSVSAPGFWVKLKIEMGKLMFAYDAHGNGMHQMMEIRYCPMCGEELKR